MKGRAVVLRNDEQQKEYERRQALATLDILAMRAWAERYAVGLLGDDQIVLISMHETRAIDRETPAKLQSESVGWLKVNHPESSALEQIKRTPAAFRGPTYSKAK